MGYERYPRGRSQDDWNRDDTRFGRDEDDAAARDYGAGSNPGAAATIMASAAITAVTGSQDFGDRGGNTANTATTIAAAPATIATANSRSQQQRWRPRLRPAAIRIAAATRDYGRRSAGL